MLLCYNVQSEVKCVRWQLPATIRRLLVVIRTPFPDHFHDVLWRDQTVQTSTLFNLSLLDKLLYWTLGLPIRPSSIYQSNLSKPEGNSAGEEQNQEDAQCPVVVQTNRDFEPGGELDAQTRGDIWGLQWRDLKTAAGEDDHEQEILQV